MESKTEVAFLSSLRGRIVLFTALVLVLFLSLCFYVLITEQHLSQLVISKQAALIPETLGKLKVVVFYFGIFCVLAIIITSVLLILNLSRSIQAPLMFMKHLALGDTTALATSSSRDEMSVLVQVANQVAYNLSQASVFTKQIGEGNLKGIFHPVSDHDMLGNSLVQMRDKLSTIAEEDSRKNWVAKGLAFFGDLLRKYTEDYQGLTDNAIIELVKYVGANQGGMFVLNTTDVEPYLELQSFYAYLRKKYLVKKIVIGEGLVGQCFLERRTIFLKEVPADYTYITSGLGDGVPGSILIVPIMANDIVEGIVELASFRIFQPHEIEFVQRICEQMAVMITSVKVRDRTRTLLEQSQKQAAEMQAHEEVAKQNIEELHATQDHLQRQSDEMRKIQRSLEAEKNMFDILMEYLPDRITYKDATSRILRINRAKALRMKMKAEEVAGKTDFDFFTREHAEKALKEEQELIQSGRPLLDIEERLMYGNEVNWASTSRIPYRNELKEVVGMFIITRDITRLRLAEMAAADGQKINNILLKNLPFIEFKVNKDGILWDVQSEKVQISSQWNGKHVHDISLRLLKSVNDEMMQEHMIEDTVTINEKEASCMYCLVPISSDEGSFRGLMVLNT